MRLLAPLLCLTWAAVADADDIDTAIAAAVGATPPQVLVVNFNNPLCPYSPSVATELAAAKTEIMKYKDYLRILTVDVTTAAGKALALKYSVGATPSLKLWVDANNGPIDLPGGRTSMEIADAALLHYGAAVKEVATIGAADKAFWRKYHPLTVLAGTDACAAGPLKVYNEFAQMNRHKGIFLSLKAGVCVVATEAPTQDLPATGWVLDHPPTLLTGADAAVSKLLHRLFPRLNRRVEPMGPRVYNRHVANDVAVCWLFEDLHLIDSTAITERKAVYAEVRKLFDHATGESTTLNPFAKGQFAFVVSDLQTGSTKAKELGYTGLPGINIGCEFNGNKFFHNEAGPTFNPTTFLATAVTNAGTWKLPVPPFAFAV